jgi:His-Xaa-Ser system protein HxsD
MSEFAIKIDIKRYPKEDICYAAYKMSGNNYVQIEKKGKNEIKVILIPKNNSSLSTLKIKNLFLKGLKDEVIRQKISLHNIKLREFMILKGIYYQDKQVSDKDSGLTPEQEKELENIIAQVEQEIKSSSYKKDPLGITRTWEERYGDKVKKQKK